MSSPRAVPFPNVGQEIRAALKALRKKDAKNTLERVAKELKVSVPSLTSWGQGVRLPSRINAKKLADHLFTSKDSNARFLKLLDQAEVQAEVAATEKRAALASAMATVAPDPFAGIVGGNAELDVQVIPSGMIAVAPGDVGSGLLTDLFQSFAIHSAIRTSPRRAEWEPAIKAIKGGQLQGVAVGIVGTVDRSSTAVFHPTPFRVPINAVIYRPRIEGEDPSSAAERAAEARAKVKSALESALLPDGAGKLADLLPIVSEDEIGGLFVTRTLGLVVPNVEVVERDNVRGFIERLRDVRGSDRGMIEGRLPRLRVIVADEFRCNEIVCQMKGEGDLVFRPYEATAGAEWVFPSYLVGYATNRHHKELTAWFSGAMDLYAETHAAGIAAAWANYWIRLRDHLAGVVKILDPELPTESAATIWANRLLSLDFGEHERSDYTRSPAWARILTRARDALFERGALRRQAST
jgi:hypothetical protein